jgi:hypothetical protein
MALTKAKLIADGVIDVDNLAAGHSITTSNIGEGSNLYYTDARVASYLTTNSYATESFVTTGYLPLSGGTVSGNLTVTGSLTGTLATAAQTNITSVGTLSSLAVSGNLTVDTNTLFVDAANNRVGIGTSSPELPLDVRGIIQSKGADSLIRIGQLSATSTYIQSISADTTTSRDLVFFGTAERMRIDSSGNVGIGTSSPTEKLTVNGNINFPFSTIGTARIGIETSPTNPFATGAKELIIQGANAYLAGSPTQAQAGGDVFIKGGYSVTNTGLGVYAGDVSIEGGEVHTGGTDGAGNVLFKTAGLERARITSTGNVGIGTTLPSTALHVNGFIRSAGISTDNSAKSYIYRIPNTGGSGTVWRRIGRFTGSQSHRIKIEITGAVGYSSGVTYGGTATITAQFNNANNLQGTFYQEGWNKPIFGLNFEQISGTDYYINIQLGSFSEYAIEVNISGGTYTPENVTSTSGVAANVATGKSIYNNVSFQEGTLNFANGYGIDFSASAGGGATSGLLDDYEEGTWTPIFTSSGATIFQQTTFASYVKIGRLVSCSFYIQITSISGALTNFLFIQGLPFTNRERIGSSGTFGVYQSSIQPTMFINSAGDTSITLYRPSSVTNFRASDLALGYYLGTITYEAQ